MSKHTPGPWFVVDTNAPTFVPEKQIVAEYEHLKVLSASDVATFQRVPNARLSAAAPDMFEALKKLTHLIPQSAEFARWPDLQDAFNDAVMAVLKAEGR